MTICFLMPGYDGGPSGGFRVVYEYANRLVNRGHKVTIVQPRKRNGELAWRESRTIRSLVGRCLRPLRRLLVAPSVKWQWIDERVRLAYVPSSDVRFIPDGDIIFATGWSTVASVCSYPESKGCKCHLIQGYEAYQASKDLVDATWRAPLHRVAVSRWLLEVGKTLGSQDLTCIPNGIDQERYKLIQPIDGRPRRVAMAFSTLRVKGCRDGIKALERARGVFPDLEATLFGTTRRESWIPKWVKYYRNPEQGFLVNEIYGRASVFLSSSLSEGFGLPAAEAGACGCAVVGTDSGGIREFIENNVSGLLSPPSDPGALAANLCLVLGSDALRLRLANACHEAVASLRWEGSVDLMEDFIVRAFRGETRLGQHGESKEMSC